MSFQTSWNMWKIWPCPIEKNGPERTCDSAKAWSVHQATSLKVAQSLQNISIFLRGKKRWAIWRTGVLVQSRGNPSEVNALVVWTSHVDPWWLLPPVLSNLSIFIVRYLFSFVEAVQTPAALWSHWCLEQPQTKWIYDHPSCQIGFPLCS